jgi:putative tryptophan/tyrosine transport system substrate-binding protein
VNKRRKLVIALGASALVFPLSSIAQPQAKVWRIGFISTRSGMDSNEEAFRQGLRELGYVEGQNVVIEWRFGKGNTDLFREFAAELVRLKMDCIATSGIDATLAVKLVTQTIPVVMGGANDDPVRRGLVASLARPGGNVTGFVGIGWELAGKRLELLKEMVPKASRVAILWDPNSLPGVNHVKETEGAARVLGMQLQSLDVRDADALENAFQAAGKGRAQALTVVATGFLNSHQARITNLAAKARLPAIYSQAQFTRVGGLMSYGSDQSEQWRGVATYVDRILKGAKPADLPVQQPKKFELIINLKAARQIGLTVPPKLLARADNVIE